MKEPLCLLSLIALLMTLAPRMLHAQCSSGCTYTITSSTSSSFNIATGEKFCVTASSGDVTLSGTITTQPGSAMEFCSTGGNEVIFNSNWDFFTDGAERTVDIFGDLNRSGAGTTFNKDADITIHSGASFSTLSISTNGDDVTITNDGTLTTSGSVVISGSSASYTNNGTTTIGTSLTLNNSSTVTNNSDLNIGSGLTINNGDFDNNGDLDAGGQFTINSGSTFDNTAEVNFVGNVTLNSGSYSNSGTVESGGRITVNGGTSVDLRGGIFIGDELTINSGNFNVGTGNECSAFLITGNTVVNNGINIPAGSSLVITDSTDTDTVNSNNCGAGNCDLTFSAVNACFTTLPIELLRFWGVPEGDYTRLHWLVAAETNNNYFSLERSTDGVTFENISRIQGAGTSNQLMQYHLLDRDVIPRGVVYYRLSQTDFDGTTRKSAVIPVSFFGSHWEIFPNPSNGEAIHVVASGVDESSVPYELISSVGQVVARGELISPDGSLNEEIVFSTQLPAQVYFLRLLLPDGTKNLSFAVF